VFDVLMIFIKLFIKTYVSINKKNQNNNCMRYAFIFLLTIFFGVSNAQRSQNIKKEDVVKSFKNDINFWRVRASKNLSNSNQSFTKLSKSDDADWSQTKLTNKEVSELICPTTKVPKYDNLGNQNGYSNFVNERPPSFIAVSESPELKNKIGFGFQQYDITGTKISYFILFTELNNWPKLKNQRQKDFLKLLAVCLQNSTADSAMNAKLNNKDSKLHLLDLNISESDSLPLIHSFADFLFKGYEKDFMSVYYSGKDSSYYDGIDQFGNFKMESSSIHEYLVNVYDEDGNSTTQKTIPYSINMNEICLFFDKLPTTQTSRSIYPGANFPIITESGTNLGNINSYLSKLAIKRISQTNQTLIDYLIQIYN